ncbi:hypothetical protein DPMN_194985 [Dreissena polymorpha]|uniref:Uncharacterized protein n=1 Tax=Dreissena polymorpha TaxID=45954 RepID=A0A9D3XZP5_DREPO|nr:hypothetical protein DPMN_194985 [Dreissena polymorpha]
MTPIHDVKLHQHGVEGMETPITYTNKNEDYDFLKDQPDVGLRYGGIAGQNSLSDTQYNQNGSSDQRERPADSKDLSRDVVDTTTGLYYTYEKSVRCNS